MRPRRPIMPLASTPLAAGAVAALGAVLAALCATSLAGCKRPHAAVAPPPAPVITAEATVADVGVTHSYPGTTTSIRMVEINARVEGWVVKQRFKDGQMVQEGDVLYEIDPRPFEVALEQALADLGVAEAEYENARIMVERNRPLVPVEAISAQQFDQMVARERSTKAATEARKAAIDQARLNLSYCTVRALSSGQVSKTQVYEGTLVGPAVNNKMTNIQVLDPIWVEFNPIAADIPALRTLLQNRESSVQVSMPPGAWSGKGRIVFIDNHVDQTTDTILARAQLENKGMALVPGAYVSVGLPVQSLKDAVTVPETAVIYQTAAALVWVVENGAARSQVVELGPQGGAGVVITKGLKAGDRVVVQGQVNLRMDGQKVAERAPAADAPAADAPAADTPASATNAPPAPKDAAK